MASADSGLWARRPHPVRWLRAHPRAADFILAIGLTALSITAHLLEFEDQGSDPISVEPTWWTVLLVIASVFPIAWRRSHTIAVASVVVASQIVTELADVDGSGFIGVIVALYTLGAYADGPARSRLLLLIALSLSSLFVLGVSVDELDVGSLIASTVVLATAFVVGDNLRQRREAAREAEERAVRAERERELIAEQQLNAERSRIARELHDVVAHSVSVMVIQAAAARRSLESSPDNAREALSGIEETGRQTMNELRSILGVLRRSEPLDGGGADADLSPQPGLDRIDELLRQSGDLPVDVSISGEVHDLPRGVALTGYRIVQEALTNVRRHAGPVERVSVTIEQTADGIEIMVADDGRGAAADATEPGYGLLGMSERVASLGGTLDAGSRPGGGWRITAHLPIEPRRSHAPAADRPSDAPAHAAAPPDGTGDVGSSGDAMGVDAIDITDDADVIEVGP